MVFSVRTYGNINQSGLEELGPQFQIDGDKADNPDVFIVRSQNLHHSSFPENLKAIVRAGSGTNNIPVDRATQAGIVVFNTPGANANAVKEAVLASIFLSARDYISAHDWVKTLVGSDVTQRIEAGKRAFLGKEIANKTLGVIGLGAIGGRVSNDAYRLGMNVLGYDPYISVEAAWYVSSHVKRVMELKEIFAKSDYITVHVPLTDSTFEMFNGTTFSWISKNVTVINFSRGELVNNEALVDAIDAGVVERYITDFSVKEVLNRDRVIVFPHVGGSTEEAELNCSIMAGQTIRRFMETGEIVNSVNFPDVRKILSSPYRITLISRNIPNVASKFSTYASDLEICIDNITHRSKGDYAYTLLDLEESSTQKVQELVDQLGRNKEVVRVRLIKKQTII